VSLILFGFAFGKILTVSIERTMLMKSFQETAEIVNQNVIKHFRGDDLLVPKSDSDYHKFSHEMGHLSLGSDIERIKIWNKDMFVVWFDDEQLVGRHFPDNTELKRALSGELVSEIKDVKSINQKYKFDHEVGRLLELYVPVRFDPQGDIKNVFEVYQNLDPLYERISHHKKIIWLWTSIGFTVLYLVLYGIVWNASKQITVQTKAIMQSRQDWEDTFDTITDMITIHDKDFNIIHANKAAKKILGLPLLEEMRAKCFTYYHGTDKPMAASPVCDCINTGKYATHEFYEPQLNKFIEIRAMPRFDNNNQIMGLIHIVRDISDKRKDEEKIKKQLDYINSLHTIDKTISSSLDLSITLNVLLEQIITQLKIDAASVLLLNSYSHFLEYAAGKGFRTDIIESSAVRLGEGYAGRAAFERKSLIVNDFSNVPAGFKSTSLIDAEGFKLYIGVPLIAKGKVKGVLEVFCRSVMELDPEWMNFLNTLTGQAAVAIDNATMVDDLHRTYDELRMAYDSTIEGWSRALDHRDKETEGHSQRVTELTVKIARRMGIKDEELVHIRRGALLHDIGKLGVPDNILLKTDKLTDEEWEIMKRHPVIAHDILSPIAFLRPAIDIPYYHHEKWDGSGYPIGLKGMQIPISARIFAIVDVWDALTSDRPYRPAWTKEKVIEHIRSLAGVHFDSEIAEIFLNIEL
jgi:PAS domain S-box-containing protein